jgi:hypothetical protein
MNCTSLILAKLREEPENAQYVTRGTKYPTSAHAQPAAPAKRAGEPLSPARVVTSAMLVPERAAAAAPVLRPGSAGRVVVAPARREPAAAASLISATTTFQIAVPDVFVGFICGKQVTKPRITLSLTDTHSLIHSHSLTHYSLHTLRQLICLLTHSRSPHSLTLTQGAVLKEIIALSGAQVTISQR